MKNITYLILLAALGCNSPRRENYVHIIQESAPPSHAPWSEGQTTTYWVGRSVVGRDGNVIHEAHPVYRRENAGEPQLAVPSSAWLPPGVPTLTTNSLIELNDLLLAEMAKARDLTTQVVRTGDEMQKEMQRIRAAEEAENRLRVQILEIVKRATSMSNGPHEAGEGLQVPPAPNTPTPAFRSFQPTNRYLNARTTNVSKKALE